MNESLPSSVATVQDLWPNTFPVRAEHVAQVQAENARLKDQVAALKALIRSTLTLAHPWIHPDSEARIRAAIGD